VLQASTHTLCNGTDANLTGVGYDALDVQLGNVLLHNAEHLRERSKDMEVVECIEQRPLAINTGTR